MDSATQVQAADTHSGAADALTQDESLQDPLTSESEWMLGGPASATMDAPNEEEDAYNRDKRASKQTDRKFIDHEELWSSKGSKSKRSVKRFNNKDKGSSQGALFGETFAERGKGDVGSVIDLAKGIKKRLPSGGKPTKLGKALSGAAGKVGDWGTQQKNKVTGAKDKVKSTIDNGDIKAGIANRAETDRVRAKHVAKKVLKKATKRKSYDGAELDKDRDAELAAVKSRQKKKKAARHKAVKDKVAKEKADIEKADREALARDNRRKATRSKKGKALSREERIDQARATSPGKSKTSAKKMLKGAFSGDSLSFGSLGDESGVEISDFGVDQSGENYAGAGATPATSKSYVGGDGSKHSVEGVGYRAGAGGGASAYSKRINNGAEEEAGAHTNVNVGIRSKASVDSYSGNGRSGVRAASNFRAGVGAQATAGARSSKKLGGRLSGVAETSGEVDTHIGLDSESSAMAEVGKYDAKTAAKIKASVGARIKGKAGANAALKLGKTDMLAARAKGDGEAFAGVEGEAEGSASASLLTGAKVGGKARVLAGAKAEGKVSAGVTVGGVDGDVNAKGEAIAGATAGAEGSASVSLAGIKAGGKAEAFAGAKAQGEIGFDFGGGGLNLGEMIISGKAMAGAGANGSFNVMAMAGKLSAGAEAGAALGVGVGMGMQFRADALFPIRLIVDQVLKNGAAVAGDTAAADTSGTKWCFTPGETPQAAPAQSPSPSPPSAKSPAQSIQAASGPMNASETLGSSLPPEHAELLAQSKEQASQGIKDAFDTVGDMGNDTLTRGMSMLGELGPALFMGMLQAEAAHAQAASAVENLMASVGEHGQQAMAGLVQLIQSGMSQILGLLGTPLHELLNVDFETQVEVVLAKIRAAIESLRAAVVAIIERTEAMVIDVGLKLGETILAPIRGIADTVGGVISSFGGELTASGAGMIDVLSSTFGPAESGLEVEGLGSIQLAHPVSPKLGEANSVLGQAESFFGSAGDGGFGKIVDDLAAPILQGALSETPKRLAEVSKEVLSEVDRKVDGAMSPLEAAARTIASSIAPAVNALREFLRKLAEAFGWF